MCWIGSKFDERIANKDITVYKAVYRVKSSKEKAKYLAPFNMWFEYEIGKTYFQPMDGVSIGVYSYEIHNGLHCFSPEMWVERKFIYGFTVSRYGNKSEKEHSWDFKIISPKKIPVIMKCTIPQGTKYYQNSVGEIVTEKLIVEKDCGFPLVRGRLKLFYKQ